MTVRVCLLWLALAAPAQAADLVFKNGQTVRGARVITQNDDFISVQTAEGVARFPIASIKTIDGKPLAGEPAPAPEIAPAPADPAAESKPEMAQMIEEAEPDLPATQEDETLPQTAEAQPEPKAAKEVPADKWNFEIALLALLVGGGIWMRSLAAVQRDIHNRRAEPRWWSLAALLLPGVGAAAYFAAMRVGELGARARSRHAASEEPAAEEGIPKVSGTGMSYPWKPPPAPDPADHLAKKGGTRRGLEFLDTDRQSIELKADSEWVSGLDHAGEMLEEALLEGASDVHIEPTGQDYRVRFRLDGILRERMTYDTADGRRLVTSLKTLAEIDIAEKRKAQDGRFRARAAGREVDFRVATANSIYGEKMVIRVLDHQSGVFDLTSLGMSDDMLATFQSVIQSRNGMILATGPTGSGKTSTLYAALRQLDSTGLNIMTIEDPAEYELAGATQIAVNPKAGVTYESGLRSILRQDPDVILVGEMRDAEAAEVAIRAALTGHLVLSSLHTKDAIGTISRLQDMKIERYQVASALLMVLSQRLVRVLCPDCRQPYGARGDELESLGFSFEPGATLYAASGCNACLGTGFRRRTGIFELLVLDEDFRKAIGEGADESSLTAMALERGFKNYRYDGAEKILLGITTVDEVLQAV